MVSVDEAPWERKLRTAPASRSRALLVLAEGAAGTGRTSLLRRLARAAGLPEDESLRRTTLLWSCGSRPRPPQLPDASPVLLLVDDVHLAGAEDREWLRRLFHRPPPGLAAVVTYRAEGLERPGLPLGPPTPGYAPELTVLRHRVAPWSREQVGEAAAEVLGERSSSEAVARLHERSGGVARVVTDLLAVLAVRLEITDSAGLRVTAADVDAAGTPERLAEQVLGELAELPEESGSVVRAAAVLGGPASREELLAVSGLAPDAGTAALVGAVNRALLTCDTEGRYHLPVPAAAEALLETLPWPLRQDHHRRAAQVLGRGSEVPWAAVAGHRRIGGDVRGWLRAAEKAAQRYEAAGDHSATVALLEEVLASPAAPPSARARLAPMLARGAVQGLVVKHTAEVLSRIVQDEALPNEVRGEIRLTLGLLCSNQIGAWQTAQRELELAAGELREVRPDLAARAMSALALPNWPDTPLEWHLDWIVQAEKAAEASGSDTLVVNVSATRATLELITGDPHGWEIVDALPARDPDPRLRLEAARGLCNAAETAAQLGYHERADALLEQGLELLVRSGAAYLRHAAGGVRLLHDWRTGAWADLAERLEELVSDTSAEGQTAGGGRLLMGLLALARGELSQAASFLTDEGGSFPVHLRGAAHGGQIRLALAHEDLPAAARTARAAWQQVEVKGVWLWAADLAPWAVEAVARSGDTEAAQEMVAAFAAGLDGSTAPAPSASLLWSRAALAEASGRPAEAVPLYQEASRAYEAVANPYSRALVKEGAVRCALSVPAGADAEAADDSAPVELVPVEGAEAPGGQPDSVEEAERERNTGELLEIAEVFTELGANWDAARARALLRTHYGVRKRSPGRPSFDDRLSPRELEVAELAATGLTNREIASTLHLSPRTVEQHVARAIRKTGADSRRGLAEAAGSPTPGPLH